MRQEENYDVLRLIEHGQICYISSDNVQGKTLARHLKYHPLIGKEQLFSLLKEIAVQLERIHRCRGNPCYQYVNPYSIIVAEDGQIYFLDMQAESNREQIIFMQRRDIREYFLPPEEKYYQHASKELDIYGLGKTFQYILASTETEPHLSRREECRLQRMISRAMGTQSSHYQNVSEIQKQIPKYKEKENNKTPVNKGKRRKKVCITILLTVAVGGFLFVQQRKTDTGEKVERTKETEQKKERESIKKQTASTRDEEYLELTMAYFLNVGDTEKSVKCLKKLGDTILAENMKLLIKTYEKQEIQGDEETYKKSLEYLEKVLGKRSKVSEEKKKQEIQCLVRGYSLLTDEKSVEKILNLVKEGLQREYLNDSVKKELLQYQAAAFEKQKKEEEAAKIYTEILETETQDGNREQLYKKITQLYEASGRRDMASDICTQGIRELEDSEELRLLHMRLMCADPSVSREECAQKIKEYAGNDAKILENEEFKKLQREYEIKVEGENVWVGR